MRTWLNDETAGNEESAVKADDFETTVLHVLFKYCQAF
jgi:hypothetical protein